jgi:hypothetical protein
MEYIVFNAVFDALSKSEVKKMARTMFDTLLVEIPPQKSVFEQTITQNIWPQRFKKVCGI